jgi:hypothetical protein
MMLAFVDEQIARGAAHAMGHPIDCVLLRERGAHVEAPRRRYRFSPSGDTTWMPIRDRRTDWRAGDACARLRASAYYRWWVSPPPTREDGEGAEALREAGRVLNGATWALSHAGEGPIPKHEGAGGCDAMTSPRENFEFVTSGSALVGGGSSIQRSASAAVIWTAGSSHASDWRYAAMRRGVGENRTPRGISKYPGASHGNTNQPSQ